MNGQTEKPDREAVWSAIPIGAGAGVALGLVLMNVLNHNGFFAVGIGIGLALGVAVGLVLDRRQ